jgi:hypothetical protein
LLFVQQQAGDAKRLQADNTVRRFMPPPLPD